MPKLTCVNTLGWQKVHVRETHDVLTKSLMWIMKSH